MLLRCFCDHNRGLLGEEDELAKKSVDRIVSYTGQCWENGRQVVAGGGVLRRGQVNWGLDGEELSLGLCKSWTEALLAGVWGLQQAEGGGAVGVKVLSEA